ncbi:MAG: peptide-methionine (S)-S-oxide reductase MsrA [Lachnospiraceae bacterium]|nr:peptide-methionine (S)-S-oxide reductase MsrA [Lachnospiraceae bacterium]
MKTIYLAGGCFWGTQKFFAQFDGVVNTCTGYANGKSKAPTYEEVCKGSGHAETVKVEYDETVISLTQLLEYYFMAIDPTSVNQQGEDVGEQYRTGIYYEDASLCPEIQAVVDAKKAELEKDGKKLAVEYLPLQHFYAAEEYHQDYLDKNPTGYCHLSPALFRLGKTK